jgi:hypothetical protein
MINWLQNHLLPCPFKYITGIDCPGCGFQRSVLALLEGHLQKSFILYPATIPVLMLFAFISADGYLKFDTPKYLIKKLLFALVCTIITINYGIKIWELYKR